MAQPDSIVNNTGQKIDTQYDSSGVAHLGLAIGDVNATYTPHAAWKGVATHIAGATVGGSDGVVVLAGKEAASGHAVPVLVDTAGRALVSGAAADGAAVAGNPVLVAGSDGTNAQTIRTDAAGDVLIAPSQGTLTDRSGTIAAGATSQQLAAVNAARRYLFIQNLDAAEDLWFNFTTDAVVSQPSIKLGPGQSYENPAHFCSTEKVTVIATTTSHAFTAKEA